MASYLIKKNEKTNEIISIEYELHGYKFEPKKKPSKATLEVKEITIINPKMIDSVLSFKFNTAYKKILMHAIAVIDDDDASDGSVGIVLDELARLKAIIKHKYQEFLTEEKEQDFLKKIALIEKELMVKRLIIKEHLLIKNYEDDYIEEKTEGHKR